MVSCLVFRSLFLCMLRGYVVTSVTYWQWPAFPTPLAEETVFSIV